MQKPQGKEELDMVQKQQETAVVTLRGRVAGDKAHGVITRIKEKCVRTCFAEHKALSHCGNSHSHPCCRSPALRTRISRSKRKKQKTVEHTFTSSSTLPSWPFLSSLPSTAVIFSIYNDLNDIKSLKTRPDYFFFVYPTGLLLKAEENNTVQATKSQGH